MGHFFHKWKYFPKKGGTQKTGACIST